jgi:hypothetical protein
MTPLMVAGAVIDVLEGMELAFLTSDAAKCKV